MIFEVKILPLIIGVVFNMILGMLWYSPVLFLNSWTKEAGLSKEDTDTSKGKMGKVYLLTGVFALITSYVIGFIMANMGIDSILNAILVAIMVWAGMSMPMMIKDWGFEKRSVKLGVINHSYELVVYVIVAVLYAVM